MRRAVLIGILCASVLVPGTPGPNGFTYRRTLTIDHTKISSSDQAIPFYIDVTAAEFATTANGGRVNNTASVTTAAGSVTFPADLIITTDSNCSSLVTGLEPIAYSATTGRVAAWVYAGTLSASADTVLYACYGKVALTTFQYTTTATWPSEFAAAFHLEANGKDSTTNAKDGAKTGTVNFVSGEIGSAASITGSANNYLTGDILTPSAFTFSAWVKGNQDPSTSTTEQLLTNGVTNNALFFDWGQSSASFRQAWTIQNSGGSFLPAKYTTTLVGSTWYHVVSTWDGSNIKAYLNGSLQATTAATSIKSQAGGFKITWPNNGGVIDEVRVLTAAKSADWVATMYNSQSAPSTFSTLGAEVNISGGVVFKFLK